MTRNRFLPAALKTCPRCHGTGKVIRHMLREIHAAEDEAWAKSFHGELVMVKGWHYDRSGDEHKMVDDCWTVGIAVTDGRNLKVYVAVTTKPVGYIYQNGDDDFMASRIIPGGYCEAFLQRDGVGVGNFTLVGNRAFWYVPVSHIYKDQVRTIISDDIDPELQAMFRELEARH